MLAYLRATLPPPGRHHLYFDHGISELDALYAPYLEQVDEIMHAAGYRQDIEKAELKAYTIVHSIPLKKQQNQEDQRPIKLREAMKEIKWVKVAETNGITPAELLAGRLQAAGIPARAVQEGAGQAYGLTVGLLGTARVLVPDEYLEEARALLDLDAEAEADDLVTCPHCDSEVELSEEEWEQGWFQCPVCAERVELDPLF